MGSSASILTEKYEGSENETTVKIKGLPEAIENSVFVHEKFPLIIDTTDQAGIFLKYQVGPFINMEDPLLYTKESLNRALVSALKQGTTMTLKCTTLKKFTEQIFDSQFFPREVLSKSLLYNEEIWRSILKPELGDPSPEDVSPSQSFVFILCTTEDFIPSDLLSHMRTIRVTGDRKVENKIKNEQTRSADAADHEDNIMTEVAELYGASETIRNSVKLVEAAFDGELSELKSWVEKGYHIESEEGRKYTALSEAASQGHLPVASYLLEQGANPNARSDTGRSPIWRACFNGHEDMARLLLEAGSDPDLRDTVSLESAYDVAKTPEIREILTMWDKSKTVSLIAQRKAAIQAKLDERIRTAVQREQLARLRLRQELVETAESGQLDRLKEQLAMIAADTETSGDRPRATAENSRNPTGQSLLSIATQRDDLEMARFLLEHWREVDADRYDLTEGQVSGEAQVYRCNPNSRDAKGWTCVCIAVFHDSRHCLELLLQHGGDPSIRSSYNKNAWDLSKDELDAAEKVVRSKAEIRKILNDFDLSQKSKLFGNGATAPKCDCSNLLSDLGPDGTAMVMNIEINQEATKEQNEDHKQKFISGSNKKTGKNNKKKDVSTSSSNILKNTSKKKHK